MPVKPQVLFFDVNETLLDLTAMKRNIADVLDGNENLLSLWFTTMLQYSLVTSASGQYRPFGHIGAATLQMVAANNQITLSEEKARETVVSALRKLPAHPEVKRSLKRLKDANFTLAAFTNGSQEGVTQQFEYAGLTPYFDAILSVEGAKKFKPFQEAYQYASQQMNVSLNESMMIAAHGWDVAGAQWAGWRAAFIKRPGQQLYPLAPTPEIVATDLEQVTDRLLQY
ncbi:haloacid dehalogenase type II [Euzebyella saccharophila]|uniref:Haloacid dehalogenase type II n=1 Tax=Euzebyella saccharophila TaxID=679664 RepID=A0ABV8JMX7_9FLAO|nr:haloacid dehalogenase type II [Euzebyella saccharophila]